MQVHERWGPLLASLSCFMELKWKPVSICSLPRYLLDTWKLAARKHAEQSERHLPWMVRALVSTSDASPEWGHGVSRAHMLLPSGSPKSGGRGNDEPRHWPRGRTMRKVTILQEPLIKGPHQHQAARKVQMPTGRITWDKSGVIHISWPGWWLHRHVYFMKATYLWFVPFSVCFTFIKSSLENTVVFCIVWNIWNKHRLLSASLGGPQLPL